MLSACEDVEAGRLAAGATAAPFLAPDELANIAPALRFIGRPSFSVLLVVHGRAEVWPSLRSWPVWRTAVWPAMLTRDCRDLAHASSLAALRCSNKR